jgi:hypothetical protein
MAPPKYPDSVGPRLGSLIKPSGRDSRTRNVEVFRSRLVLLIECHHCYFGIDEKRSPSAHDIAKALLGAERSDDLEKPRDVESRIKEMARREVEVGDPDLPVPVRPQQLCPTTFRYRVAIGPGGVRLKRRGMC